MEYFFNWLALGISIIALLLTLYQMVTNKNRSRKQATIDAFNRLQTEVMDKVKNLPRKDVTQFKKYGPEVNWELWNTLTAYLARVEHFSVGINTKIYDIKILNRLAGGYIISFYYRIKPIIEKKRDLSQEKTPPYEEFELVKETLEKSRNPN